MADYKELYLHLSREVERAVRILIAAQQTCEARYIEAEEPPLLLLETQQEEV